MLARAPVSLVSLVTLLALALALAVSPLAARADRPRPAAEAPNVFDRIDALRAAGAIDEAARHAYRVAAIRDPGRLPEALRRAPVPAVSPGARDPRTAVLVEAIQWAADRGREAEPVRALLAVPPDHAHVLDSATLPLRVSYSTSSQQPLAEAVLAAAETSWTVESGYGFRLPAIEEGTERYRFYIEPTGFGGGGYTAPYAYDESTPRVDCLSYIVVDDVNYAGDAPGIVAHEVNHAMQGAMDCAEVVTFWENTATYIMSQVFPGQWPFTAAFMPYFQEKPWQALDFMDPDASDLSEYGGVIFALFLADFAPGAGPALLADVWEATEQPPWENEPDYYDAVESVIGARGGPATFEELFADFTEARYFVGSRDDGAHLSRADDMGGAELALTAQIPPTGLPVEGGAPSPSRRPAPYGSNHLQITLPPGAAAPYEVTFDGEDTTRWAVRVLLVSDGLPTLRRDLPLDPATWQGSITVDPEGRSRLVLSVANLGLSTYDPDTRHWPVASYTYGVAAVLPPPAISALDPAVVERGATGVAVTIHGSDFVDGDGFAVAFDDPSLSVRSIDGVDATEIRLTLDVAEEAPLGPRAVTVTNAGGDATTAQDLLTVVEPPPPPEPECGCAAGRRTSGGRVAPLPALLVLAALALRLRRSRG